MNELENPVSRNDHSIQATSKPTDLPPISNRFLLYTSLAIICILAIFRHIKRQRTHLYAPPPKRRKMSSPDLNPSGEHSEKSFLPVSVPQSHTPNHSMHATTSPAASTSISTSTATAPFPSACDILQPLSQLTPLPASGHVAAAVIRGRKLDWNFTSLFPEPAQIQGPGPSQSRRGSSADPETPNPASLHPDETVSALPTSSRPAIPVAVDCESASVAGIGRALVSGSAVCSCHPHPFPSVVAHGSSHGDDIFASETGVDVNHDHATGSVQRRNETVHFLQDSDTDGPRSWKRLIVEYN